MKRMFIVALTLCIGACASQPQKAITAEQPAANSAGTSLAAGTDPNKPYKKVFIDDYELLHVKAPPQKRTIMILGQKGD